MSVGISFVIFLSFVSQLSSNLEAVSHIPFLLLVIISHPTLVFALSSTSPLFKVPYETAFIPPTVHFAILIHMIQYDGLLDCYAYDAL